MMNSRSRSCAARGGAGKRKARGALAPIDPKFLTGEYFSALVRRHDWPPGFAPAADAPRKVAPVPSLTERERQAVLGIGWGTGTQPMARTPGSLRPTWMLRPPGRAR